MSHLISQRIQVISNLNDTDLKTVRTALKRCVATGKLGKVPSAPNQESNVTFQFLVSIHHFCYDIQFRYNSFGIIVSILVSILTLEN